MKTIRLLFSFLLLSIFASAQMRKSDAPFIAAEVFIEPGQTPQEIESFFKTLHDKRFSLCRIRMFETYMQKADGSWDFSLFDTAFKAADKYGIKVYANPFALTEKTDIGGFKFPNSDEHLESVARFLKALTQHFSKYKSLYGYVLINEPGTGGSLPDNQFVKNKFAEWSKTNPAAEYDEKGYPILVDLRDKMFLRYLNTWFLNWIAAEIRKYDSTRDIHVNNHAIFENCAEYDFPAWRQFLTSLGGSAHASWHFGYFQRNQYSLAMSANAEIIRSGTGKLPWFMTELQGGNNTYSGGTPICPTREEIAQWLWLVMASEGKGSMFWSLNPRSSGIESGEWALIDFQGQASDRLSVAGDIACVFEKNASLLAGARVHESGIHVLYVRESLWAESKMTIYPSSLEGRQKGACMKSALAYFEAFSQAGINASLGAFEEFDFSADNFEGKVIILANQIALPGKYASVLEKFVMKGGTLLVEGLSAYYNENLIAVMKTGFPFEKLFGGNISEFKAGQDNFDIQIGDNTLPSHLWKGLIRNTTAKTLTSEGNFALATENKLGKGRVIWVPSLIGLGSRMTGKYDLLFSYLDQELNGITTAQPFRFAELKKGILLRTMKAENGWITVLVNQSGQKAKGLEIKTADSKWKPEILYCNGKGSVNGNLIEIDDQETLVLYWK